MFYYISYRSFLQACTALSPDEQLRILKHTQEKENTNSNLNEKDCEILKYYMTEVLLNYVQYLIIVDYLYYNCLDIIKLH